MNQSIISLSSENSLEFFPENNGSNFSNLLNKEIQINALLYELGLCEIWLKGRQRIFTNEEESVMYVRQDREENEKNLVFKILSSNLDNTIQAFNVLASQNQFNLSIAKVIDRYEIRNPTEYDLRLPTAIAFSLGFRQNDFPIGDHLAPQYSKNEYFKKLELNSEYVIKFFKPEFKKKIHLVEPTAYTLEGTKQVLNLAIFIEFRIGFLVVDNSFLRFEHDGDNSLYLTFSSKLEKVLGIEPGSEVDYFDELRNVQLSFSHEKCFVQCNILSEQEHTDGFCKTLRIVSTESSYHSFSKVFYKDIWPNRIRKIDIQILTANSLPVPIQLSMPTVVTLHLRLKK